MESEFIIETKDFEQLPGELQAQIKNWITSFNFSEMVDGPEWLEGELEANVEDQKKKGYIYSEVQAARVIRITKMYPADVVIRLSGQVRTPHAQVRVPDSEGEDIAISLKYNSPKYSKQLNSQGARILEDLKALWAAQAAQEAEERAARDRRAEEDQARRQAAAVSAQAARDDEREYIKEWIAENGSERLKKAVALELSYENLFIREWTQANFKDTVKIFLSRNSFSEYGAGVPTLEEMQKYEEAKIRADNIPGFAVSDDISKVSLVDPEEGEEEDTRLAIVYEVHPETLSKFWVIEFI